MTNAAAILIVGTVFKTIDDLGAYVDWQGMLLFENKTPGFNSNIV